DSGLASRRLLHGRQDVELAFTPDVVVGRLTATGQVGGVGAVGRRDVQDVAGLLDVSDEIRGDRPQGCDRAGYMGRGHRGPGPLPVAAPRETRTDLYARRGEVGLDAAVDRRRPSSRLVVDQPIAIEGASRVALWVVTG